ncbi:hypothetical protein GCM10008983_07860 [Lentibacillus halophilus]|uniref:D-3-phosphoglycerate dehydrogenase n=1 Tax=Lentibacillus halophilus TaxID=295065 RepID=A0ABN0Z5D3_9BACI
MKVAIIYEGHEHIPKEGIKLLESSNYDLLKVSNPNDILENSRLQECNAIMVRGATINKKIIDSLPYLKIIARCGVGVDNIDIQAASDNDVYVCNVPDANFVSVSEHVTGLIMNLSRRFLTMDRGVRTGNFNIRNTSIGRELRGKTIGIIGYGRIGQLVAKKCIYGFDMEALVFDPYVDSSLTEDLTMVQTMDDILIHSDFVTLHLPYNQKLHHLIDKSSLEKMKTTACLINCARGGLVDEEALAEAVKYGDIAGAGIDVYEVEPPSSHSDLLHLENVILTPHIGATTEEALFFMATGAAEEIKHVLEGNGPSNCINQEIIEV